MIVSFGKNVYSDSLLKKDEHSKKQEKNTPNIKYTKAGNPYYKTNVGKKTGAIVGVLTGAAAPVAALISKNAKVALMMLPPALITVAGCMAVGSVVDSVINRNERKKVDQMKSLNINA